MNIQDLHNLLEIINKNQALVIGQELGVDYLTQQDLDLLSKYGIDLDTIHLFEKDTLFTSLHFGLLSDALADIGEVNNITYQDLYDYIERGDYIPLTEGEQRALQTIKTQSFSSIKGIGNKIFQDINNILENNTREEQESFIKKEAEKLITEKKTIRQVANDIARKTGDWNRDFDRIIQYTSQTAFETGKALALQRKYGEEVYVYKSVFQGACKHCIRLYLTKGLGSAPKVFKISELIANGSNIGRKVEDWKPTLDPIHPYCRCTLQFISNSKNFEWDVEKKDFKKIKEDSAVKRERPKVRAVIGGKEVWV